MVMAVVMAVMMVVMMMNTHLEAQDERINDSSTSAARVMVKYEEVDGGRSGAVGKLVKKSSKSRRIVKKSEKPQRPEKFAKAIGSKEPSFLTSDTKLAIAKMSPS